MKVVANAGSDRVLERLRGVLRPGGGLDVATPRFSLFAYEALRGELPGLGRCRLALGPGGQEAMTGGEADRARRNQLRQPWLARECAAWLRQGVELRDTGMALAQAVLVTMGRRCAVIARSPPPALASPPASTTGWCRQAPMRRRSRR
jgi:hypothetical protein